MDAPSRTVFSEMNDEDARALLERQHLGRIAYSLHDHVEIEPISYVCQGEWIFLRTSDGSKTQTLQHHPWVAFQVDEIHTHKDWESVVVQGRVQDLMSDVSPAENIAREQAIAALRTLDSDAFGRSDDAPHRQHVMRLHLDTVTGRRATSKNA